MVGLALHTTTVTISGCEKQCSMLIENKILGAKNKYPIPKYEMHDVHCRVRGL